VKDGFQTEKIMGSHSYFIPVTAHSTIRKGDRLPIHPYQSNELYYSIVKPDHSLFTSSKIKCRLGPEFDMLNDQDKGSLFKSTFVITKDNNRMGYRLEGSPHTYPANYNMLTSSVLPGTVQLTPSGQLIVLMQDCQTTGGYPRILQVTQSGINSLAHKKSSDAITFEID
jgi:allophanate hydrolase subunit 2